MSRIIVTGGAGFTQPHLQGALNMYYVYLLQSKQRNERYIGSTNDLRERIKLHNSGKVFSTKRYCPWTLVYYEAYQTEKLARHREKQLKYHGSAKHALLKRLFITV